MSKQPRVIIEQRPWHDGYEEGRTKKGDVLKCPYVMNSEEAREWMRGFDSGKKYLRLGITATCQAA